MFGISLTKIGSIVGASGLFLQGLASAFPEATWMPGVANAMIAFGAGGFGIGMRDAVKKNGQGK